MNEKRAFLMLVSFGLLAIITNSAALFTTLNYPDPISVVTANPSSQLAQVAPTSVNLARNTSGTPGSLPIVTHAPGHCVTTKGAPAASRCCAVTPVGNFCPGFSTPTLTQYTPSWNYANDGNLDTVACSAQKFTGTPQSIKVDLGSVKSIERIEIMQADINERLANGTSTRNCHFAGGYQLRIQNPTTQAWETVHTVASTSNKTINFTLPSAKEGRNVEFLVTKVLDNTGYRIGVKEFRVWGRSLSLPPPVSNVRLEYYPYEFWTNTNTTTPQVVPIELDNLLSVAPNGLDYHSQLAGISRPPGTPRPIPEFRWEHPNDRFGISYDLETNTSCSVDNQQSSSTANTSLRRGSPFQETGERTIHFWPPLVRSNVQNHYVDYYLNCSQVDVGNMTTETYVDEDPYFGTRTMTAYVYPVVNTSHKLVRVYSLDSCEIPFTTIGDITEDGFQSWATIEPNDVSGDRTDLSILMDRGQCRSNESLGTAYDTWDYNTAVAALDLMKSSTDLGTPIGIGFVYNQSPIAGIGVHVMIALSVSVSGPPGFRNYNIEVLDPNGPSITNVTCQKYVSVFMRCTYDGHFGSVGPTVSFSSMSRESYCAPGSANASKEVCNRGRLTDWLRSNYPNIPNFLGGSPRSAGGVCQGWTDVVLTVANYGNFIGERGLCRAP